jgi:hypothetical protein
MDKIYNLKLIAGCCSWLINVTMKDPIHLHKELAIVLRL